jgi:hypothetical protein
MGVVVLCGGGGKCGLSVGRGAVCGLWDGLSGLLMGRLRRIDVMASIGVSFRGGRRNMSLGDQHNPSPGSPAFLELYCKAAFIASYR